MDYLLICEPEYRRDWLAVEKVVKHPPHTWSKYEGTPKEFESIIEMEMDELTKCHTSGDYHCYVENLLHVAAACVHAHHKMTCKEDG